MVFRYSRTGNCHIIRSNSGKLIGSIQYNGNWTFKPLSGYEFTMVELQLVMEILKIKSIKNT